MVSTSPDSTSAIRRAYTCPNTLANVVMRSTARKFAFALFVLPARVSDHDDDDDGKCVVFYQYYETWCKSRKGGWLSLSLKMSLVFRETRLETKFKFTKRRKVVFDDERG